VSGATILAEEAALARALIAAQAVTERAAMLQDIATLTIKVDTLSADIRVMVEAWKAANFALSAVKWIGSVVMAFSAFWFVVTHFGEGK